MASLLRRPSALSACARRLLAPSRSGSRGSELRRASSNEGRPPLVPESHARMPMERFADADYWNAFYAARAFQTPGQVQQGGRVEMGRGGG